MSEAMDDLLDRGVDRLVIRGDPLTEPEVSRSWVKVRAVLAIVACSVPGLVVAEASSPGIGLGLALGAGAAALVVITSRINQRIEEGESA